MSQCLPWYFHSPIRRAIAGSYSQGAITASNGAGLLRQFPQRTGPANPAVCASGSAHDGQGKTLRLSDASQSSHKGRSRSQPRPQRLQSNGKSSLPTCCSQWLLQYSEGGRVTVVSLLISCSHASFTTDSCPGPYRSIVTLLRHRSICADSIQSYVATR